MRPLILSSLAAPPYTPTLCNPQHLQQYAVLRLPSDSVQGRIRNAEVREDIYSASFGAARCCISSLWIVFRKNKTKTFLVFSPAPTGIAIIFPRIQCVPYLSRLRACPCSLASGICSCEHAPLVGSVMGRVRLSPKASVRFRVMLFQWTSLAWAGKNNPPASLEYGTKFIYSRRLSEIFNVYVSHIHWGCR